MANKKISDFSVNTSPSGDNIMPIVASGVTEQITLSALTDYIAGGFSGGKQVIGPNDDVTIKTGFQFLVYGDLVLSSGGTLSNEGDVTIINGSFINSGGTYNTSGGTINLVSINRDSSRIMVVDNIANSGATIDIVTYTTKTFVRILTPLTGDTYFTCSDTSRANIGDTLIISTIIGVEQPWTGNSFTIIFNFDTRYLASSCSSIEYPTSKVRVDSPRNIMIFTFDGDYWVNTYDNC